MAVPDIDYQNLPDGVGFEILSPLQRLAKGVFLNPLANFLPSGLTRAILKFTRSQLAHANWADPGGWESMVISYEANPEKLADKVLISGGTISMALRNRRKLGAYLLARLIEQTQAARVHLLCLGAGPGTIAMDALTQAKKPAYATLVDISSEAFAYGLKVARERGLAESVRYVQADIRHVKVKSYLDHPPHVVKMLGICEYLPDEMLVEVASATASVMPDGASILLNTLNRAHGTDRFFRRVFGLHMIYRSCDELAALMGQAGFGQFTSQREPLGVYDLIVARKLPAKAAPDRAVKP
jgi:predicted RNA methylase